MNNAAKLSREELIALVHQQATALVSKDEQLAHTHEQLTLTTQRLAKTNEQLTTTTEQLTVATEQLATTAKQLLQAQDVVQQLEVKLQQKAKEYAELWQARFRRRSERYIADPRQYQLDFGDTPDSADAAEGLAQAVEEADLVPAYRRRKPRKNPFALPEHLPRKEEVMDVDEAARQCDLHGPKQLLPETMWDVTETLVHVPASHYVLRRKYPKYACPGDSQCGITSAERPTGLVEGDKYDTSVATQIIVHKYAYHSPLYRQQEMFAGTGWLPSRSVLANILERCHFVLVPMLDYMKRLLQSDRVIACDDTGVTLLYPKIPPEFDRSDPKQKRIAEVFAQALQENKSSINAKMWIYRGFRVELNVFDFTVSRHRDGPAWFFDNYSGKILGDCWHGFEAIAADSLGAIVRAACNAHARRYFDKVTDYPADRRRWLGWYQQLYNVEHQASELSLSGAALVAHRQSLAGPIWAQMRAELDSMDDRTTHVVLPKSDLRKAINYVSNHWTELRRYLDDPLLPIDNNLAEQQMKQVAIGRKNWLFCGSVSGGERAAGFLTLVSSAHRHDLDVWSYVNGVLKRLLAGETDYEQLMPWNWAKSHPTQINEFRQQERQDRIASKHHRRQHRRAQTTVPTTPNPQ